MFTFNKKPSRQWQAHPTTNPSYVALSYVWGPQTPTKTIQIDNHPWSVTRNLFDALSELQEAEETIVVWVDAICIDQTSSDEKGWQVSLMSAIYRQATRVIAWLGPAGDGSDAAVEYLDVLGRKAEACGMNAGAEAYAQIWLAMETSASYMEDPERAVAWTEIGGRTFPVTKGALKRLFDFVGGLRTKEEREMRGALRRFFRRAWWGRMWVLQEIALAERGVFACGGKRIGRERLRAAFNAYHALCLTLSIRNNRTQDWRGEEVELYFSATHKPMVMLSMSYIYRIERFPLVALLQTTCVTGVHGFQEDGSQHLESTDPRDKIFALLGLARDREELKAMGVEPDYTKSKREVYVTTMMALLQQGHISLLSFCRAAETSDRLLPSWVLDWSLPLPVALQDVKSDHSALFPEFNASASSSGSPIFPLRYPSFGRLSVMAIVHDELAQVGDVPRVPMSGTCVQEIDWLAKILQLTYDVDRKYTDFNARLQAVVRASHAAIGYAEDGSMQKVDRFCDALPTFQSGISQIKRREIKNQLRSYLNSKEARRLLESGGADVNRLRQDFMRTSAGRSPFVTRKGHLGLSSEVARQGDVVAVIGRAQVPFVLRPCHSGGYRIIGEAYVDEIMDGEATEDGRWEYIDLV